MTSALGWTPHESALWETCRVLAADYRGESAIQRLPVNFGVLDPANESVFVHGEFRRQYHGEGERKPNPLLMTYRVGKNLEARRMRWRDLDGGEVWVSTHGFYLRPGGGRVLPFGFGAITEGGMAGPRCFEYWVNLDDGRAYQHRLVAIWSELVFFLWSNAMSPHHPQRASLGWLPPEFVQKVVAAGLWETSPLAALMNVHTVLPPNHAPSAPLQPAPPVQPAPPNDDWERSRPGWQS